MPARTPLAILPVLVAVTVAGAGAPTGRSLAALGPALDAANTLMAQPWRGSATSQGLAAQFTSQALAGITGLNGKALVDAHGSIKNVAKWRFALTLQDMAGAVDLKAPPGYSAASANGFTVEAPLGSSWSFAAQGRVQGEATACCTPAGKNVYSEKVSTLPIVLGLSGVHLAATVAVNATDPTRPTLTSAAIQAKATLVSNGIFPPTPVTLAAHVVGGHLVLTAPLTNLSVGLGSLNAKLTGSISLTLLPSASEAGVDVPGGGNAGGIAGAVVGAGVGSGVGSAVAGPPGSVAGGIEGAQAGAVIGADGVHLSALFQEAIVELKGGLSVRFPDPVGRQGVGLDMSFPVAIPSTQQLVEIAQILLPPLPRVWPPAGTSTLPGDVSHQAHGAGADFGAARDALESGIAAHLPYGTIFSFDYPHKGPQALKPYTYGLDADSTIWTGHYLAAEAFRYAATGGQQGLDRVTAVLSGLQRDLDVTDAAVEDGKPVAVQQDGFLARATLPVGDLHGLSEGPFQSRGCYYVHPEGGWTLAHGGSYATYGAALKALKTAGGPIVSSSPVDKLHPFGPVTPVGKLIYGFGCGSRANDHPISRDQYAGVFMGLAYAYKLVPPAQPAIKQLVDRMLGALVDNNWNVPLPPDGTIVTTFLGNFDAQLALLRVGATVDPGRWGALYDAAAPASQLAWISSWFSSIDPLVAYFKFNLGHAFLGPTLFLEPDDALRANYLRAYDILRAATSTNQNAYFNLVDLLVGAASPTSSSSSFPSASLAAETASDLADWVTRWQSVRGTNLMPRNATSPSAAAFLAAHFGSDQLYLTVNLTRAWFASFTLPLQDRVGDGMDFVWQRSPFQSGLDSPGSTRKADGASCAQTPPRGAQIASCTTDSTREGPGIDFLLPYWLGVYLKVIPA